MQSSEMTRAGESKSSAPPAARAQDSAPLSLPDAEAFKLGSERLLSSRSSYLNGGERRSRHPDSEDQRNGIFERLVNGDEDVTGLIAYSIYKQNKRDWLKAFETVRSRAPTLDEEVAYTIGESTPRRLATYRHMAESTFVAQAPAPKLPGNGLSADGGAVAPANQNYALPLQRAPVETPALRRGDRSFGAAAAYAIVLGLAGFGLWASLRFLFPGVVH